MEQIQNILQAMSFEPALISVTPFRAEEDGREYQVWKLDTAAGPFVLKKTCEAERQIYETFFQPGDPVPACHGFARVEEDLFMLLEFVPRQTLSRCDRDRLRLTLDGLICLQKRYWNDSDHADVGYGFRSAFPNRQKRLAYMGDLEYTYRAYLDAFETIPRTLCNDDLLPFNVLCDGERAAILDWEYAGILPWPSALARLLAFGEEDENAMFFMTEEDRQFALDYYFAHLIGPMGISRAEYDRTMKLFFFKEYGEWVYCAGLEGDFTGEYYKKYYPLAKALAGELNITQKG